MLKIGKTYQNMFEEILDLGFAGRRSLNLEVFMKNLWFAENKDFIELFLAFFINNMKLMFNECELDTFL